MKLNPILMILWMQVLSSLAYSQKCDTERETLHAMQDEPAYAEGLAEFDSLANVFELEGGDEASRGDSIMYVPVVVHVLYRYDVQNISYEQIRSQIDVLNRDFRWAGGDHDKIPDVFRSVGQACEIQFRLADRDPWGNFTNGITRKQTDIEDIGSQSIYHRSSKGGADPWSQPHYLNIWVCEIEGNALGFAILPSNNMSERDGIVMSPNAFGTTGTVQAPYNGGRTLVHEVGHYFGLRHPWGKGDDGGCATTDHMSDTPKQEKENFGCKTFPHFSCGGEANGDMFMNFMDYGNDTCMLLFTRQQALFMRLTLRKNRATLFHSDGYTGLDDFGESPLKIYPVPAEDKIQIEFNNVNQIAYLISARGDIVKRLHAQSLITEFDVSDLQPGLYFVKTDAAMGKLIIRE